MSKWGLWAAHRYVQAGAAVPRLSGPDGKMLKNPWRIASEQACRTARLHRATRPQPIWPRPLGFLCIGLAVVYAIDPIGPIPSHVAASSSARTGPRLASLRTIAPAGAGTLPTAFEWRAGEAAGPFTWILVDAGYDELQRRDGIEGARWQPDAQVQTVLQAGGTFHWYVIGDGMGKPVASALATLEIDR